VRNEEGKNDTPVKDERKDNKAPAEDRHQVIHAAAASPGGHIGRFQAAWNGPGRPDQG
jgi:hypothetical protein